ncbi:MAG: hypothetical protein ACI4VQ_05445 [Clostridia bacterium]
MNEVFLIGKIITEIEFKFIIYSKNIAIAKFEIITLSDEQVIHIVAYNEMADFVYRRLNKNDIICINGHIVSNNIIIKKIDIVKNIN